MGAGVSGGWQGEAKRCVCVGGCAEEWQTDCNMVNSCSCTSDPGKRQEKVANMGGEGKVNKEVQNWLVKAGSA